MTRERFKERVNTLSCHLTYPVLNALHDIDDHDAEQRQIIDEQVEENRGLRSDVKLMQQANAEQRQQIEQLGGRAGYWKAEHLKGNEKIEEQAQEIGNLREALQLLYSVQNGCPLPKYEKDWNRAMELTQAALKEQP